MRKGALTKAGQHRTKPSLGSISLTLFGILFVVYLVGPLLVLALWSIARQWFGAAVLPTDFTLDWYRNALVVPGVMVALRNSFVVALCAVLATTLISIPAAYAVARLAFPGKTLFRELFALPLMVPYISIGVGVATAFYRLGLVGTLPGVILAHTVVSLPFGILIMTTAFESLDRSVEEAAAACGASAPRRFFTVTLPLVAPGILAQAIYVFALSMDEFTLSLLVSNADSATLPVRIYGAMSEGYIQVSSALAILLLVPSMLLVTVMVRYLKAEYLSMGGL